MQKKNTHMTPSELIQKHIQEIEQTFSNFWKNEENVKTVIKAANALVECIKSDNKIFSCGNGGSMSDAIHFAEELVGRFRESRKPLPAIALSDVGNMSCIANDYGYEFVFSRPIEALGKKGDVLLAISTSGNSPNVLQAAQVARQKQIKVIALTGKNGGKLKNMADIPIIVPHNRFADRIQEIHIQIIHFFIQYIEENLIK